MTGIDLGSDYYRCECGAVFMAEDSIERDGVVTAALVVHHRNNDGAIYALEAQCPRCVAGVPAVVVQPCRVCGEDAEQGSIFCTDCEPPF